ncbi:uncharacterized protein LOC141802665 [Halichoeres trimaculatus]|uniref:uncharacterized protein LOC141802665 n=1 Tax=Halichoeres trimaculatus TaxID=147232 RepID=UPI003D9DD281
MEDQRQLQTPRQDNPEHISTYSNSCATSSTPRVKGLQERSAASSLDKCGTEDEQFDDDDIFELVDSGSSSDSGSESVPNTKSQPDLGRNSSSSDSNDSPGTFELKPGTASCSRKNSKTALGAGEPDSEDDSRPRKLSLRPKVASYAVKNYCYFCSAGHAKLARHLLKHIGEDPDLAKAFSLPKGSKERKRILGDFRSKGNYRHNQEVLKHNCGELKLKRRPNNKKKGAAASYLHCPYCKGMYLQNGMWKHMSECPSRETPNSSAGSTKNDETALAESLLVQNPPPAAQDLLLDMKKDPVAFAVQHDVLLIKLAEHLSDKDPNNQRQSESVRFSLRAMGRLLLELHEKSITSFKDAIKPENFYTVVRGVERIASYSAKRGRYTKPSLALKLGHLLKKIAIIVLKLENNDKKMKTDARMFIKLYNEKWTQLISKSDLTLSGGEKSKKLLTVPFTRDVQLFYRYLESESASAVDGLTTTEDQEVYAALCRVTLAKVSVLNKCAPEVSRMTLKAFQEREDATQVLSRHFIRINVENKEGQNVTPLLTSDLVNAITLLVSKRNACGVHKDNPFLFAKPNSSPTSIYQGKQSVKTFSILCRAKNPEHLLAACCHKYITRVFQVLTLENDELKHLAKLLGHKLRADRDFYLQPWAAVDLAKIATLIQAMEKGCLEEYKGKSLKEVEIEDELELDEEQLSPEISDAEEGDGDLQETDAEKQKANMEEQRTPEEEERQPSPGEDAPEVQEFKRGLSGSESCNEDEDKPKSLPSSDGSEEEYIPGSGASSDESDFANENQRVLRKKSVSASSKKRRFHDESFDEYESDSSSDKKPKARYDRNKNYCFVCGKAQSKVSRHFFTHRNEDPDIAAMFKLRKNSKERFQRLNELRERGNSKHNDLVLKTGYGQLKVRQKKPEKPLITKTCLFCKGVFTSQEMRKHIPKCSMRKSTEAPSCKNKVLFGVASAESADSPEASSEVSSLLKSMKQDEITAAVMNDSLLLLMARYIWLMNEKKKRLVQKLRWIGSLLLTLKKSSVSNLEDAMKPENFGKVVEAVKELSDFNEERKSYGKPCMLKTVGCTLKHMGEIHYARALSEGSDKQRIEEAQAFMKLSSNEWGGFYKTKSTRTVPFIQDVQLLFQSMEKTAESALESLTKYACEPVYCALSKVVVAHLLILNQNTEIFELSLKSFQEREEAEAAVGQSQLEQILSAQSRKISVMSNKGKPVIVTLTPALLAALELLESKREACGVNPNSLFLFAQPGAQGTNFFQGIRCFSLAVSRCNAGNKAILRSLFFRKHLTRVFQILSLSNEHLDELAKLLGREIKTDREHYQKLEAVPDIARLLELLSAVETGTLERFEGKSFEEIEFAGELKPHSEPNNPENSDAEEDDDESESSFQRKSSAKKSSSRKKPPGSSSRKRQSKGRGPGKRKREETDTRQESEDEASELKDEEQKEVNTEQDDRSEEKPESPGEKTSQETPPCRNNDTANMSYSDNDDDMDVDFDSDEDIPGNEENNEDDGRQDSEEMPLLPSEKDVKKQERASLDTTKKVSAAEEMDTDSEDHIGEDQEEAEEQRDPMDVDSRSSSPPSDQEKRKKVLAAMIGKSQLRIVIPKLDLEKLKAPILLSQLFPAVTSVEKDQPVLSDSKQHQKSSTSTDASSEKEIQMMCSHCREIMLKGQTAFQKKGFTDVFCSKDCLFKMFPVNKPVTRPCFHCSKDIANLSDLIMAAVDAKGTIKDFCSMTCLCSFRSNSASPTHQRVCNMCKKSGTTKCGLMINDIFYKFCSENCFEDFRRANLTVCAKCKATSYKPLKLKLREETQSFCSQKCLDDFTKEIQRPYRCTMCGVFQPASDMVTHDIGESIVELFCARSCVISYKLRPVNHREMNAAEGDHSAQEEMKNASHSTANRNDAPPDAETSNAPTVTVGDLVYCTECGKVLPPGKTVCPRSCVVPDHQHRKCFSCNEVISRPQSVIRVPVDDQGMRELCSDKCLASINSKRSLTLCKMCNKRCEKSVSLTLDEFKHKVCSDTCFINYHAANDIPFVTCEVCGLRSLKQLTLRTDDGDKLVCSGECLVKIKESIKEPQMCPMCQMFHQMSDMVEDQNEEGRLDFFCSNRCMMVHKAQSLPVPGRKIPLVSKEEKEKKEEDIKEEQITLNMDSIKQEPIEEEYKPDLGNLLSNKNIKDEPNVAKDDLKTEEASSFSSPRNSTSTEPTVTTFDVLQSCSSCNKVLMDGETAYQKKNHSEIFCSSPCLLKFFQMKEDQTSCTFCLQTITRKTRTVLQAPVDDEGTMKDFCSQTCMFSFNYKRMMNTKVSIVPVASHSQCSMCNRYCISKHEVMKDAVTHKICSDPCFVRFCNLNKMLICVNCYSNLTAPLTVSMEDCCKQMCSAKCLAQYKKKAKTPHPCTMCGSSLPLADMVESKNSEDEVEFFCSSECVAESKIQAVCKSGVHVACDNCGKKTTPACHFSMSDDSIRSFCSHDCAMTFKKKGTALKKNVPIKAAKDSDQTQTDLLEQQNQLFCAKCERIMETPPKVIKEKDKVSFVCSQSCSEEFMMTHNILEKCEHCKKKKIPKIIKRVDGRDCFLCSEGCKMLFHEDLKKQWGEYCQSCAYCLSISQRLVKERYIRTVLKFCSDNCNSRYSLLFKNHLECDACGLKGRLSQSLSLIGEIKYFCNMMCVQRFCNKIRKKDSSPQPVSPTVPSPVITSVISLASAVDKQSSTTSSGSNAQISYTPFYYQANFVGHASVQTDPKELKNKATLCTPLVHNKGVSCAAQTVNTSTQTDNIEPRTRVLPVPVPVYVPLPLNMYSQFTPKPVGLPIPVPVPVFLPGKPDPLDEAGKPTQKEIQTEDFTEKLDLKSEAEKVQHEKQMQTDRKATEHSNNHTEDQQAGFNNQEETCDNRSSGLPTQPPVSETDESCERQRERTHTSLPSAPETKGNETCSAPGPSSQTQPAEEAHNKNKGLKLQDSSDEAKEETRHEGFSKAVLKGLGRVESQCGVSAWKRWIQWRRTLKKPVNIKEEILLCSAAELSNSLALFIRELKQQDAGETHPPDRLFYLCLCIQQYLFENGRMENIFSDSLYFRFSSEFTKILRGFKPSVTASGYVHFHVEEEFLWECKQLGAYSPAVLLNTLLFFCCKSLGFTTVEQHRQLSFAHIVRRTKTNSSNTRSRFLLFYLPKTTTEEKSDDGVPAQKRKKTESVTMMMENAANPLRCPVRLYEFYLSKCSEAVRQLPNVFYLQPVGSCVPSSPVWFTSTPLDDSTMEAMLVRILAIREMWGEDGEGGRRENTST